MMTPQDNTDGRRLDAASDWKLLVALSISPHYMCVLYICFKIL
jgi:hypothetical protein